MKTNTRFAASIVWMLLAAFAIVTLSYAGYWTPSKRLRVWAGTAGQQKRFSENIGARSFDWSAYQDGQTWKLWSTMVGTRIDLSEDRIQARELQDRWVGQGIYRVNDDASVETMAPCVAISPLPRKHAAWMRLNSGTGLYDVVTAYQALTDYGDDWENALVVSEHGIEWAEDEEALAIAAQSADGTNYVNIVYADYDEEGETKALLCAHSEDGGEGKLGTVTYFLT